MFKRSVKLSRANTATPGRPCPQHGPPALGSQHSMRLPLGWDVPRLASSLHARWLPMRWAGGPGQPRQLTLDTQQLARSIKEIPFMPLTSRWSG